MQTEESPGSEPQKRKTPHEESKHYMENTRSAERSSEVSGNDRDYASRGPASTDTPTHAKSIKCGRQADGVPWGVSKPASADGLCEQLRDLADMGNEPPVHTLFKSCERNVGRTPRQVEDVPRFISSVKNEASREGLTPSATAYIIVRFLVRSPFALYIHKLCAKLERDAARPERIIDACTKLVVSGSSWSVFKRNWKGRTAVPRKKREPTSIVDEIVNAIGDMVTTGVSDNESGNESASESDLDEPECLVKASVICLMNSSGTGKTSAVIDAARKARCAHLLVNLSGFDSITNVAGTCEEFLTRDKTKYGVVVYRKDRIIDDLRAQYEKQLAVLFSSCLEAIAQSDSQKWLFSRAVKPKDTSETDAGKIWADLVRAIPAGKKLVLHVDECQTIFEELSYPENGDLVRNQGSKKYSLVNAHRLALSGFISSLLYYISGARNVAWVFTGGRLNFHAALNIPTQLNCVDLSGRLQDLNTDQIYNMLAKFGGGVPKDGGKKIRDKLEGFLGRLVGPPFVIRMLLDVLSHFVVRDLDDVVKLQLAIEAQMRKSLAKYVPGLIAV